MKAVCWMGMRDMRVENVDEPTILNPGDAILKVTSTAICGSDLHLYNGFIPTMQKGDIVGHEFMGEIVAVGSGCERVKVGDRVTVPFPIACGKCFYCEHDLTSLCDNSNPEGAMAEKMFGFSPCGIFGYSHLTGGYAGGQAEFVRVPFADFGCLKIPEELTDEKVLFLTDILPTGYMAADLCNIQRGDVVAVWGAGPVGLLAMVSARLLGAERVIAIDRIPERLALAERHAGAECIDYTDEESVVEKLRSLTGGRGPDACIDAVGMEAHGLTADAIYDRFAVKVGLETGRPVALRQAILACRKGGTVSIVGVFGGMVDKIPMGAAMNKSLTFKMGQTHVHRYMQPLLEHIRRGDLDPSFIISHRLSLDDAPKGYEMFKHKEDECVKVVLKM